MIPFVHRHIIWIGILMFHLAGANADQIEGPRPATDSSASPLTNAAAAQAQDSQPSGLQIYVSPIANDHLVKRPELLREEYLREAIIFLFQYSGVAVARLNADPVMTPQFGFIPPERTWATVESNSIPPGGTNAAIHIQNDTSLRVLGRLFSTNINDFQVHGKSTESSATNDESGNAPEPRQIVVDAAAGDFIPVATQVAAQMGISVKTNIPSDAALPLPDAVTNSARLDWSFGQRLKRINELIDHLNSGKAGTVDFAELAALFTLHGAYYGRCNEDLCYRYFGRARVFAELAARSGSPWTRQLREEIDLLTLRFGAGNLFRLTRPPLLPETDTLLAFEGRTLADAEHYPPVNNLFDFLVRCDSVSVTRGEDEAVVDFLRGSVDKHPFDAALVWSLPIARNTYKFDAAMFMLNAVGDCFNQQKKDSLEINGSESNAFNLQFKDLWELAQIDPSKMLQSSGTHFQGRWDRLTKYVQSLLPLVAFVRVCDQMNPDEGIKPRTDMQLDLQETLPEIRDRLLNMLLVIRYRFIGLGWGSQKEDMDFILGNYGWDKIAALQFYEVAPEFTSDEILAPAALISTLQDATNSSLPGPASRLLHYLTPPQKAALLDWKSGSPFQDQVSALLVALNGALDDRTYYDGEFFGSLQLASSLKTTLAGGMTDSSLNEVRLENRQLLETAFSPWLAARDHSKPSLTPLGIEMSSAFAKARRQYYHCDFDGAVQRMTPWMPALGSDNGDMQWNLLRDAMQRDGRVEETFAWIGRLESFARDDYRFHLLRWESDLFPGVPDGAFDENTDSDRDYVSRAEYALRKHDFATMRAVMEKFHYTAEFYQTALSDLSEIMTDGRDDASRWQRFETSLASALENNSPVVDYMQYWLPILDEELGQNPHWQRVREVDRLADWATLAEATKNLSGKSDDSALDKTFLQLDKMNQRLHKMQELHTAWLLQLAIRRQHQALARWLIAKSLPATPEADSRTLATIELCQGVPLLLSNVKPRAPDQALVLMYMLRFGARPNDVAAWLSKVPKTRDALAKYGPPEFSAAVSNPALFARVLDSAIRPDAVEDFNWVYLQPLPRRYLYGVAARLGAHDYALRCGRSYLMDTRDIVPLLPYLRGDSHASEWIERNAPNAATAQRWKDALAASHVDAVVGVPLGELVEVVK